MFKSFKNKVLIKTVLEKAHKELNNALIFRKKQFDNPNLFFVVDIDAENKKPYISLVDENKKAIIRMRFHELLEDESIQKQLARIPSFLQKMINYDKITRKIDETMLKSLKPHQELHGFEGKKELDLFIMDSKKGFKRPTTLQKLFI